MKHHTQASTAVVRHDTLGDLKVALNLTANVAEIGGIASGVTLLIVALILIRDPNPRYLATAMLPIAAALIAFALVAPPVLNWICVYLCTSCQWFT
jgi:hypothetical protein